jgi:hypothetical protein
MSLLKGQMVQTKQNGTKFDVVDWRDRNDESIEIKHLLASILIELKGIKTHMAIITDEELAPGDEQDV